MGGAAAGFYLGDSNVFLRENTHKKDWILIWSTGYRVHGLVFLAWEWEKQGFLDGKSLKQMGFRILGSGSWGFLGEKIEEDDRYGLCTEILVQDKSRKKGSWLILNQDLKEHWQEAKSARKKEGKKEWKRGREKREKAYLIGSLMKERGERKGVHDSTFCSTRWIKKNFFIP